jgi:hypothetical protein
MMPLLRRLFVITALLFWQGGFTFYAAVVVPVAQEQLGHRRQGFITRQVTHYLNAAGAVSLVPLAWDAAVSGDPSQRRRRGRWLTCMVLAVCLVLLVGLHLAMDQLLDVEGFRVLDESAFRRAHRGYLWVSTVQWAAAIGYTWLALIAWRQEDARSTRVEAEACPVLVEADKPA